MATWKKILVSGSNISELNNDSNYLLAVGDGVFSGSAQVTLGGVLTGTADNANYSASSITNVAVSPAAAIDYTKINFNGSNIVSGAVDLGGYTTTASFNTFTASYYVASGSTSTRLTDLESWSASLDAGFVSEVEFGNFTASYKVDSGSWNTQIGNLSLSASNAIAASASFSTRLSADEAKYDAYTSSFTTTTLSVLGNSAVTGAFGVQGNSVFSTDVLVQGNLTVNGTASFVNVEELIVKDKFITLNSGSNTLADAGLIFQSSTTGVGSGPSLFLEATSTGTYGRMAMATSVNVNATTAAAAAYVNTTEVGTIAVPVSAPVFGDTTNGYGNMYVNSLNGDIWIYA